MSLNRIKNGIIYRSSDNHFPFHIVIPFILTPLNLIDIVISEGFSAGLMDENLYEWQIMIIGPQGTPFEGGFFKASLKFPTE